jgi:predicted ribosome quality control (RQC) complex YloA/Tae2 family protein
MSDEAVVTQDESPANDDAHVETTPAVAVEAVEPAKEMEKPSLKDDLSSVWDKMHAPGRPRDEMGRFAKTAEEGETVDEEDQAAEPAAEQAAPEQPAQQKWTDPVEAVRAKWDTLDQHAKELITQQSLHLQQVSQQYEPVGRVLQFHTDYLKAVTNDVPAYLNNLLTYSRQLDTDPVGTLRALADMYKVDLTVIADPFAEDYVDPTVAALKTELAQVKQQLSQFDQHRQQTEQQRVEQQTAQLVNLTQDFFAKNPDALQIADEIELQVRAIKAKNPTIDPQTALAQAYDRAQWTNDGARQARLKAEAAKQEQARADAARKAADQAKRAKSININGAIANRKPASPEETMASVWDRLHS